MFYSWLRMFGWMLLSAALIVLPFVLLLRAQPGIVLEYNETNRAEKVRAVYYVDIERGLRVHEAAALESVPLDMSDSTPDGRRVIPLPTPGNIDLFLLTPDEARFQLTHFKDFPPLRNGRDPRRANLYPLWSPDGQWIIFLSSDEVGHIDLYALRPDRSDMHPLAYHINTQGTVRPRWVQLPPG